MERINNHNALRKSSKLKYATFVSFLLKFLYMLQALSVIVFVACSSTDNFLSPILVSDQLIFCCGNLILHQKNENKNDKNTIFLMKNNNNNQKIDKSKYKHEVASLLTRDALCFKLQRFGENIDDKKLSVEHTLRISLFKLLSNCK